MVSNETTIKENTMKKIKSVVRIAKLIATGRANDIIPMDAFS